MHGLSWCRGIVGEVVSHCLPQVTGWGGAVNLTYLFYMALTKNSTALNKGEVDLKQPQNDVDLHPLVGTSMFHCGYPTQASNLE